MPLVIRCPNAACGKPMQVPDDAAGKQVRCPTCKTERPAGAPAPPPPPARPAVPPPAPAARPPAAPPRPAQPPSATGAKTPAPTKCPACGAELLAGAIACMDCGFLLQAETTTADDGTAVLL